MRFVTLPRFEREFKRLGKKYRSLPENFAEVRQALARYPRGQGERHWNLLYDSDAVAVFKMRMICDSLKNNSLRLVYAYFPAEARIEFIEIYFKGDKESEDQKRIKEYLAHCL